MSGASRRAAGLLLCLLVLASGCLYQGYHRVSFRYPSKMQADYAADDAEQVHTLAGLIDFTGTYSPGAIDVTETCPDGFAEVAHYQTAAQASWIPIVPLLVAPFVSGSSIAYRCVEE